MRGLTVLTTGPLATFQDRGRPGYAHLGVPRSGAADLPALSSANRLVGNPESATAVETTFGGFSARARGRLVVAVTGPPVRVLREGCDVGSHAQFVVDDGQELRLLAPEWGCRNYLAVRGGFDAPRELGSSSTDTLSGLGPPALAVGDDLPAGTTTAPWPEVSFAPPPQATPRPVELFARLGPRDALLVSPDSLSSSTFTVNAASNRIGVRLDPPDDAPLVLRPGADSIPSEGVPLGGVQIPPGGQPVLFLADHPVTGGYPIVAVLTAGSVARAAQSAPGDVVRLVIR
ncbi:MAG: biotin-dependent carboxyltransferase family protein [Gordonia sp. (in: high G+C Gram-positive bacteria)]